MVEQLQLFDPSDYIGMDGSHYIEVDVDEDLVQWYKDEASRLGVTFDEFVNSTIKRVLDLTCPTCKQYRGHGGECPHCGELDH
jgi:hypothetical protein